MEKTNSLSKKTSKVAKKPNTKPRVNYKQKYEDALTKIKNLELSLIESKTQNELNINSFQAKAKGFQAKAQKEVDKIRKELAKKTEQEQEHFKKYGSQNMIETTLETLLNLEQAIKAGEKNEAVKGYVQGFKMLLNQLYENLASYGVQRITPKIGDKFNPKLHHAFESKKGEKNKILEIKRDGFSLYNRVIKPAIVIIGK